MRVLIDIPEYAYEHIREYYEKSDIVESTYSYIYHGTPISDSDLNEAVRIAYQQGRQDALEEVRAEIRELPTDARNMVRRTRVLDIINKHKGE